MVYISQLFYLQHNIANESVSIFPVFPYTCISTWNVLYVYILNYRKIYEGQAQESYNWGINTDLSELVWLPSSTTCIYHKRNIIYIVWYKVQNIFSSIYKKLQVSTKKSPYPCWDLEWNCFRFRLVIVVHGCLLLITGTAHISTKYDIYTKIRLQTSIEDK